MLLLVVCCGCSKDVALEEPVLLVPVPKLAKSESDETEHEEDADEDEEEDEQEARVDEPDELPDCSGN